MLGLLQNIKLHIRSTLQNYQTSLIVFFVTYIFYISSHYASPKAIYSSIILYTLTIPSMLYYLYINSNIFSKVINANKLLFFLFIYIISHSFYMMHEMEMHLFIKGLRNIFATFLFVIASLIFFVQSDNKVKNLLFHCLCMVGIICAIISLIKYFYFKQFLISIRLVPFGFARHEILGASLYGVIGLIALHFALEQKNSLYKACFFALSILIMFLILLTFSRGPILAYGMCFLAAIILYSTSRYKTFIYIFITFIILTITLILVSQYTDVKSTYLHYLIERGTSYRIVLWKLTIEKIIDKPLLGYGIRNIFTSKIPGGYSPHNIYLSTMYYFGIPTLIILVFIMIKSIIKPLLNMEQDFYAKLVIILFMHATLSTMTDHGQLARGNTPIWIIFWLPICIGLAYNKNQENS